MSGPQPPWREGLFDSQVMLVAGDGGAFGPAVGQRFRRLGAFAEQADAADAEAANAAVGHCWSAHGRLDTLVTLACTVPEDPGIFDAEAWRTGVESSLSASWYRMHAAARQWRDRGRAGSIVAVIPPYRETRPRCGLRRAAGASIAHLVKTVAVEWAAHRLRVNCIAAATDDAEAVADAVVWLTAPSGKFVTGEVMNLGTLR